MSPTIIANIILSVLSVIETLLPQLGVTSAASTSTITTIINALTKIVPVLEQLAPLAIDEVKVAYQGIKNIISNLQGSNVETTAQQDADLDALDTLVDNSWNSVAPQFDPDYVAPGAPAPPPSGGSTPTTGS